MKIWTVDNPPEWLKGRKPGEILFALAAYRAAMGKGKGEDEAREAALSALAAAGVRAPTPNLGLMNP